MLQWRRNFLVMAGMSLGLTKLIPGANAKTKNTAKYKAVFACRPLNEKAAGEFEVNRLSWEKPGQIGLLAERYAKEGKLLNQSYSNQDGEHRWEYIFSSRADFEAFNKEIFLSGYFMPEKVLKEYNFSLGGEYV